MDASDLERLIQRVARLESFNRRLSRIVVVLLVVLASAVWMGQRPVGKTAQRRKPAPPAAPKVVEAEQFVLKSAGGKVLATLGMTDNGPMLRLVGPNGADRAVLALDQTGAPHFALLRTDGSQPLRLALTAQGVPQVEVSAPDKSTAQVTIGAEGRPEIAFADPSGMLRLALDLKKDGPAITMGGKTALVALSAADAGPSFALSDPEGYQRITMKVVSQNAGFSIRDSTGHALVGLEVKAENPALGLYNTSGKALFVKP